MKQKTLSHYQSGGWDCPTCGKVFSSNGGMKAHHARKHGESISGLLVVCDWCGDLFRKKRSATERYDNIYCSMACRDKSRSNHYRGEKHHNWKGGKEELTCEYCGEKYRVKSAEASRSRFCGEDCLHKWQSENKYGPNAAAWKGGYNRTQGLRKALGPKSWTQIRRDHISESCYKCGSTSELQLHHIIPIRSGGTHGSYNLMTLCVSCHATVERYTEKYTKTDLFKYEPSNKQRRTDRGDGRES